MFTEDDYYGGSYNPGGDPYVEPGPAPAAPGTADPNAWLTDPNAKPPFDIPGQEWFWNGSQWSTKPAAQQADTITTADGSVVPNPGAPNPYDPNDPHYDYGPGTLGGTVGVGPGGGGGGGGYGGGGYGGMGPPPGGYDMPMFDAPDYGGYDPYEPGTFTAPDPKDIYNDPSYLFRFDEGMRPLQNSRAAQGLTRTGATLKQLQRYGQQFGSNEYDRIYGRARDTFTTNEGNRFGAYKENRAGSLDAYDRRYNAAKDEFAPRQRWAELQYGRDWDLYKYQNDDAFRYYNADLNASSNASQYPGP